MFADTPEQKDRVFLILTGVWLFTALFLFGNPVILDYLHSPKSIGFSANLLGLPAQDNSNVRPYLGILAVLGLACVLGFSRLTKPKLQLPSGVPKWLAWLPVAWLGWQLLSYSQTEDHAMSLATVIHFTSCLAAFYLGLFVLSRMRLAKLALWGAALGLIFNLVDACVEKFGGLELTRNNIIEKLESSEIDPPQIRTQAGGEGKIIPLEIEQQIAQLPPKTATKVRQLPIELVKRMYSTRLYGHMFYPNALAGVILLLLPVSIALLVGQGRWHALRISLATGLGAVGLACLYWSGSKAGWLISLVLLGAWFLYFPLSRKLKLGLASVAMVLGLTGFAVKYADYFDRGATSVGARFGYWGAAVQSATEKPLLGTGPGTFQLAYKRHRTPDAEPTRLTHNDYLQQASDSGVCPLRGVHRWSGMGAGQAASGRSAADRRAARPTGLATAGVRRVRAVHPGAGLAGLADAGLATGVADKSVRQKHGN